MRLVALLVTLCAPALALAGVKEDLEKQVRRELTTRLGDAMPDDSRILVNGWRTSKTSAAADVWDIHGDFRGPAPTSSLQKLAVTVDEARGLAWFHAQAKFSRMGNLVRLNGIARKGKAGWQLVAASYTWSIDDKTLVSNAKVVAAPKAPALGGDAELAKVGAAWFTTPSLAKQAGAKPLVNGTADGEYEIGAAATKLAAKWDKLKMQPLAVDGWSYGDYGLIRAKVALPIPKQKTSAVLILTAVVVKEQAGWRWVSLNWAGLTDLTGTDYEP
jgi:hypothetical protein